MATHSFSCPEKSHGQTEWLQSVGLQRIGCDWSNLACTHQAEEGPKQQQRERNGPDTCRPGRRAVHSPSHKTGLLNPVWLYSHFGPDIFAIWEAVQPGTFRSLPGLCPLDASPSSTTTSSCDNQKYLLTCPDVPWGQNCPQLRTTAIEQNT